MKDGLFGLYALQRFDLKIYETDEKIKALTAGEEAKKKYAAIKAKHAAIKAHLESVEKELRSKEEDVKALSTKAENAQKRVYDGSITTPKELASAEKEIIYLKECIEKGENKIVELMEAQSQAETNFKAAEELLVKATKWAKAVIKKENDEREALKAEREKILAERAEYEAKVTDKALLAKYKSVWKRCVGGIAKIEGGRCEGCKTAVASFTAKEALESDHIVLCENCGRILLPVEENK